MVECLGPDFLAVLTAGADVVCAVDRCHPPLLAGQRLDGWAGIEDLLAGATDTATTGEVRTPEGLSGTLLVRPLANGTPGMRWLLVSGTPVGFPEHSVTEALELVEQTDALLAALEQDLARLQSLVERLAELGPPMAVIDERRLVRAWSNAAELLCEVPADRVLGRPVANVLPGIDLAEAMDGGPAVEVNGHELRVSAEPLSSSPEHLLLILDQASSSSHPN